MCVNSIYHNLCVILTTPEKLLHMQKYCTIICIYLDTILFAFTSAHVDCRIQVNPTWSFMADDTITRGGGGGYGGIQDPGSPVYICDHHTVYNRKTALSNIINLVKAQPYNSPTTSNGVTPVVFSALSERR